MSQPERVTHPYGTQISTPAKQASNKLAIRLLQLYCTRWQGLREDHWQVIQSSTELPRQLSRYQRPFLPLGNRPPH